MEEFASVWKGNTTFSLSQESLLDKLNVFKKDLAARIEKLGISN